MRDQLYFLDITLAIILMGLFYLLIKELIHKTIKKELKEVKAALQAILQYLNQQQTEEESSEQNESDLVISPKASDKNPQNKIADFVDVSEEFIELKNTNKLKVYNLKVEKLWELYKSEKINLSEYIEKLSLLKKEYNIPDTPIVAPISEKQTDKDKEANKELKKEGNK